MHQPDVAFRLISGSVVHVVSFGRVLELEVLEEAFDVALLPLVERQGAVDQCGRAAAGDEARGHGATLRRAVRVLVDDVRMLFLKKSKQLNAKMIKIIHSQAMPSYQYKF